MDKNIELQEVKELQTRFNSNVEELNQHFESVLQKIMGVTQISSFQGKTADGIKGYLAMVHGKIISSYMESAELLKGQFQKTMEDFSSTVDSDADVKIYGSYLDDVKKRINGYNEGFNHSNDEARQTVGSISDIIAIQYPSSSGITEGSVKSQKEISDTLEKLETYNSQQNDLQAFREMMHALDSGMNQIRTNSGDFSSSSIEKIMSSKWYGTINNSTTGGSNGNSGDGLSIGDILLMLATKGTVITGKMGFVLGALNFVQNAKPKRADLIDIQKGFLANGKIANTWSKWLKGVNSAFSVASSKSLFGKGLKEVPLVGKAVTTMGKVAQEFSTIEKVAAKVGNLNHSLPENSIKAINVPKHIIKNLKPFGIPAVLINSAFEVGELHTALKSDKTGVEQATDVTYSVAKVAGNTYFSWAGGVGGVEAGGALGTLICPGIGTAVGAIAGGIIGATVGSTVFSKAFEYIAPRKKMKEYASNFTKSIKKWFE